MILIINNGSGSNYWLDLAHILAIPKNILSNMITSNVLDICVQQSRAETLNVSCECIRPTGYMIQSPGITDSAEKRTEGTDLRGWETMGVREGAMEGKAEMLTCFSPSILLSAC